MIQLTTGTLRGAFLMHKYKNLIVIKYLTYGAPYDILYTGGEKQMSNRNRKHPEKKKSDIDWKSWLLGAITDLTIGIILLILDKLLN